VVNFYGHLTGAHSYASGGSNDNEFWGAPMELGASFEKVRCWSAAGTDDLGLAV